MLRAGEKSTHHAKPSSSPAQPWSVMQTVVPRFLQTPRLACLLRREEQQARQRPMRCRWRDLVYLSPAAVPGGPDISHASKLSWSLLNPRRSRAFDAAHAPRQRLTQACAPGQPAVAASVVSSIRLRKPGSSTLPVLRPHHASSAFGQPSHVGRDGETVPPARGLAALFITRAREEKCGVRAIARTSTRFTPTHHPSDPGRIPSVPSSRDSENTLRIPPPRGGQMPPRQPMPPGSRCLRPCKPAGLSAVSACRRFSDHEPARHP